MSFCGTVALFIPASDIKNVHPARTCCNPCPTRAGFFGVVEFSGCAVLLYTYTWCMHLVTKYVCDQDLECCVAK